MLFCVSADTKTCGAPLSVISPQLGRGKLLAIVIIPNWAGMFNEKITFFGKKFIRAQEHKVERYNAQVYKA